MSLELIRIQNSENSDLIDTVEAGAKRGTEMLKQLLVFSKGSFIDSERIDMKPFLEEVSRFIKLTFPRSIEFQSRVDDNLSHIWGDVTQLHQVLMNLCGNAKDAMPHGGKLTLSATMIDVDSNFASFVSDAKPGRYVMLRVSDTGEGMPRHVLDHVFEPFFSTKPRGKGTGLGLSIVIGIVKSHSGFVNVYSEQGKGSTFSVYIPAGRTAGSVGISSTADVTKHDGNGALVLVADDSDEIRAAATVVLTHLNYRCICAESGVSALELAREHRNELRVVISDLHMPTMDGQDLAVCLQTEMPHVGVILMSGNFEASRMSELQELGVSKFLEKPFTQGMLAESLQFVLRP
jgi:CheY-like chemotaxis protein